MKRLSIIFLCTLLFTTHANAVNKKFSDGFIPALRVTQLLDSSSLFAKTNPVRAIDYASKALEVSLANHYKQGEGLSYKMLGTIHYNLGHYDLAAKNLEDAVNAFTTKKSKTKGFSSEMSKDSYQKSPRTDGGDLKKLFDTYLQLSLSYIELGNYDMAAYNLDMCFSKQFTEINNESKTAAKKAKAKLLLKQNKFAEGVSLYELILDDARKEGNLTQQCDVLTEMGKAYFEKGDYEKALPYFNDARDLAEMLKQDNLSLKISDYIAQIYRQQKRFKEEIVIRQNSLNKNISNNNTAGVSKGNFEIGNAYFSANQTDSGISYLNRGLDQKTYSWSSGKSYSPLDLNKAGFININRTSYELAQQSEKSTELLDKANAYKTLTEAYLKKGEMKMSAEAFDKYLALHDSVEILRNVEIKNAIELSTTLGKKQQRVELLEKERELNEKAIDLLRQDQVLKDEQLTSRNMTILLLIVVLLAMAGAVYFITRSSKSERRANQLLAIKSLRGQMNPHFIFNALNSVNHYISQNDERAANKYLSDFSRLMRLVMENSKHDFISLSEEVEMLELYLHLEHARFKDKFDYRFEIDKNIDTSAFELPPMILQPYIENSVWHGLRYLDNKGFLTVAIHQANEGIQVMIEDNGIGRKLSQEQKTVNQKKQNSSGMQNIENRVGIINTTFNTAITVSVEDAKPGNKEAGTIVNIFIPNHKTKN